VGSEFVIVLSFDYFRGAHHSCTSALTPETGICSGPSGIHDLGGTGASGLLFNFGVKRPSYEKGY